MRLLPFTPAASRCAMSDLGMQPGSRSRSRRGVGRTSLALVVPGTSAGSRGLGSRSPARWSRAAASPTSPAPGSGPWPPGRSSAAAGRPAGPARRRPGRSATGGSPARRPRPPAGGRPAAPSRVMCPSRFRSPDWSWLGTSPKYRPTALALRNRCGSSMNAATASAVRAPTPGMVRSRATAGVLPGLAVQLLLDPPDLPGRAPRSPRGAGPAAAAARPSAVPAGGARPAPSSSTGRASSGGPRRRCAAGRGRRSWPGSAWRRAGRGS